MPGTGQSGGHRQKTRRQHELDGTFRPDRHHDLVSPEPPPGRPPMPDGLSEGEQAEWARMMGRLEASQALWVVDDAAIYQYCRLFAETEAVAQQQAETVSSLALLEEHIGDVEKDDLVQLFTQIAILRKLVSKGTDQLRQGRMAIRQYLVEFGLTPASRGRVKLPPKAQPADEFTQYQQQRVS